MTKGKLQKACNGWIGENVGFYPRECRKTFRKESQPMGLSQVRLGVQRAVSAKKRVRARLTELVRKVRDTAQGCRRERHH